MTQLYEELFLSYCTPYDPDKIPKYLQKDPIRAYGQYAFEVGFKLGMQLAVTSLDPDDLCESH